MSDKVTCEEWHDQLPRKRGSAAFVKWAGGRQAKGNGGQGGKWGYKGCMCKRTGREKFTLKAAARMAFTMVTGRTLRQRKQHWVTGQESGCCPWYCSLISCVTFKNKSILLSFRSFMYKVELNYLLSKFLLLLKSFILDFLQLCLNMHTQTHTYASTFT